MPLASDRRPVILHSAISAVHWKLVMRLLAIALLILLAFATASAQPELAPLPKPASLFPAVAEDDVWDKLPPRKNPPLPEWAKVLSGPLPKTTAKMLELDYLHREKNPLGPVLAARLRRIVASELGNKHGCMLLRRPALPRHNRPKPFLVQILLQQKLPRTASQGPHARGPRDHDKQVRGTAESTARRKSLRLFTPSPTPTSTTASCSHSA